MTQSIDITTELERAKASLAQVAIEDLRTEHQQLEKQTFDANFWNREDAQTIMSTVAQLKKDIDEYTLVETIIDDLEASIELQNEIADNPTAVKELQQETEQKLHKLVKLLNAFELKHYLSGPYDKNSFILSIHPGQGGTEAMDWAEMLERMYQRYFERQNWKYELTSEIRGEEAGIKEASFEVHARYGYGYCKHESGTHRLVRLSPFNADNLRQTSFALVEVLPIVDDTDDTVSVKDDEIEWKFSRAGGAGGQHVNKINSAVELKHLPTGIVVKCRQERSQQQNKQHAMKMLKAQLALKAEQEHLAEIAAIKGEHSHASWGNQIRNYVLHPYQLVKDTRTEVETSDTTAVLDGDLDIFIDAAIKEL